MKHMPATRSGLRLVNDRKRPGCHWKQDHVMCSTAGGESLPFNVLVSICSRSSVDAEALKGEIATCVFSWVYWRFKSGAGTKSGFESRLELG